MNQVERISEKLGGDEELAKVCEVHRSQVSRWKRRKGGVIPSWHHQKILDRSAGRVTPADFFDSAEAA